MERSVKRHWRDLAYHREVVHNMSKELQIKSLDDWYKVKTKDILSQPKGKMLLKAYSFSITKMLKTVYPEYPNQLEIPS
jgi:hypothetical protein